jgi:tRNA-specific 2-thiouridylase
MVKQKKSKIFVGLSGGVDSSVAAALLKEQGCEVVGVFMQNWSADFGGCCNLERDTADARAVAAQLGIPFYVWNFEKEYRTRVLDYFYTEYAAGRTPNPDVMCNREIKFKLFLERALKLGADRIVTGHYARIAEAGGVFKLLKGVDETKDQSYFLCRLGQRELSRAFFPLGGLTKKQVRQKAKDLKLPTAEKKDSQGLCFVGEVNIRELLKEKLPVKPGKIVATDGRVLGEHEGAAFYTIGQRKEIGNIAGGPYYVVAKNMAANELMVSADPHDSQLWRSACLITDLSWVNKEIVLPGDYEVVIRYHHQPAKAHLECLDKQTIKIIFAQAERAITPGQLAVIYSGEELLGAGVIDKVL